MEIATAIDPGSKPLIGAGSLCYSGAQAYQPTDCFYLMGKVR